MALHGLRRIRAIATSLYLNGLPEAVPYYLSRSAKRKPASGGFAVAMGSLSPIVEPKEEKWDKLKDAIMTKAAKLDGLDLFKNLDLEAMRLTNERLARLDFKPIDLSVIQDFDPAKFLKTMQPTYISHLSSGNSTQNP